MESLLAKIEIKIWPEHTDFIVEIWFPSVTEYDGRTRYYSLQSTVVAWTVAEFYFIYFLWFLRWNRRSKIHKHW